VLSAPVVEAYVVLEEAFPVLQWPWSYAVPELLLDGTLNPFHLTVEVGTARPDVGMADAETVEEAGEIAAELGAVVSLDAAQGEGQGLEEPWQGPADSGGGAPLQDSGGQETAAVIDQGELVASLREVHEVHLGSLTRDRLGVAGPDGLGLTGPAHQGPTAAEHPVDAAQAASDEVGSAEVGVQPADAQGQLPVSATDDIQDLSLESVGATTGPPWAV
jgi:hypothetical protein